MSDQQKPEKHQMMSVGRVSINHPWYDAADVDKAFDEQAETIARLQEQLTEQDGRTWRLREALYGVVHSTTHEAARRIAEAAIASE